MAYLSSLADYKLHSVLPGEFVDDVEEVAAGWILAQIAQISALEIDARLRKRYAVPFAVDSVPVAVKVWVARIMDLRVMLRRGVDPQDAQFEIIRQGADTAKAEIREASDGEAGLYDLPASAENSASGITHGRPRHYSEASPYAWTTRQAIRGRREDGGR